MRNIFLLMLTGVFSCTALTGCQTQDKEKSPAVTAQEKTHKAEDRVIKVRHYDSGAVESETEYVNDVRHGMHKMFDEEGNLISEVRFENNRMEGPLKTYYSSGTLKVLSYYKEGKVNGEFISYYPDGKIWKKQVYEMDVLKSTKEYDPEGKLVYEDKF